MNPTCCCNSVPCATCTESTCSWVGSYSVAGTTISGTGVVYTNGNNASTFTKVTATIKLDNGDAGAVCGQFLDSVSPAEYSYAGLHLDAGILYFISGRTNALATGAGANPVITEAGQTRTIIGSVPSGSVDAFIEVCFDVTGKAAFLRCPLFAFYGESGKLVKNSVTQPNQMGRIGLWFKTGTAQFTDVVLMNQVVDSRCPNCGRLTIGNCAIPGTLPPYIDLHLPTFQTVGATCRTPCSALNTRVIRIFRTTAIDQATVLPGDGFALCDYAVELQGLCNSGPDEEWDMENVGFVTSKPLVLYLRAERDINTVASGRHVQMSIIAHNFETGLGTEYLSAPGIKWLASSTLEYPWYGPPRSYAISEQIPLGQDGLYANPLRADFAFDAFINNRQWVTSTPNAMPSSDFFQSTTICKSLGNIVTTCPVVTH